MIGCTGSFFNTSDYHKMLEESKKLSDERRFPKGATGSAPLVPPPLILPATIHRPFF